MKKSLQKIVGVLAAITIALSSMPAVAAPVYAASTTCPVQYYFPRVGESAKSQLISVINSAKKTLDIAIYSITDSDVGNAIVKAKQRGVAVRVISDKTESAGKYQKAVLAKLKAAKIPVKVNKHAGLMHLKVTIADKATVTTGSFNYTGGAQNQNDEVFVVLSSSAAAARFTSVFNTMWSNTKSYTNY